MEFKRALCTHFHTQQCRCRAASASGETVFLWPAHTLMPFLVAGRLLVTSFKGDFYQRVISSKLEDSQRLFCLALASNSLNPQITLQPQVFVYRGLYLHVFVTTACRHCRKNCAVQSESPPGPVSGSPQFIRIITLLTRCFFHILFIYLAGESCTM